MVFWCLLLASLPAEGTLPVNYTFPPNITFAAYVRDVRVSHADFEVYTNEQWGAVLPLLDAGRHPVLNRTDVLSPSASQWGRVWDSYNSAYLTGLSAPSYNSFTGKEYYDSWYYDYPMVNVRFPCLITLKEITPPGTYQIDYSLIPPTNRQWFPINGKGWGNDVQHSWTTPPIQSGNQNYGLTNNYSNTMETHSTFQYQGGEVFSFVGDDDVWVFINNQLVVDIGGVHGALAAQVNLTQVENVIGIVPGGTYNFDFFLAERHTTQSNFRITTSIVPQRDAPVAYNSQFTVAVGTELPAVFSCFSSYFATLDVFLVSQPPSSFGAIEVFNGTASQDPPNFNFTAITNGTTTFQFYVFDGTLPSNLGNITITAYYPVTPAPPIPPVPPVYAVQQLTTAAIVGIVVGSVLAAAAIAAAIALFCILRNRMGVWADEINADVFSDVPINPLYDDAFKPTDNPLFANDS